MQVAKVDATQYTELASEYAVTSFPKIKYFLDGKSYDYTGARLVEEFALFATRLQCMVVIISSMCMF